MDEADATLPDGARPDATIPNPTSPDATRPDATIPNPTSPDAPRAALSDQPTQALGAGPPPGPPGAPRGSMGRSAALLSGATFLSRIFGLLREQAFAALLGAGFYGDAFTMAFRLPNLLRDLFAEGALSAAFQPAFAQQRKDGPAAAFRLANLVATALLVIVGALVVLGVVFAPQMVDLWAAGYAAIPGKTALTVELTRVMMPFLLLVSLAAVTMGMLNAEERFLWPALAPALFNLAAIVAGVGMWAAGVGRSRTAALGWAIATLCGGALQLLVQLPALWRVGYRPRLAIDLRDPGLRKVLLAMAPATVGLMATQVNIYVSSSFASSQDGAVTWLNVAFRLIQLPIGMFGVAIGTVALSRYARSSADDIGPALAGMRDTLRRGLRMVTFLTLPTTAGMLLLAEPILGAIYEHGAFRHKDTLAAAVALRCYGVGLLCYAAVKVVAPVFYALSRARVAVIGSVMSVTANVAFNVAFHGRYGYAALALGTSLGAIVNLGWLVWCFQSRYGGLREHAFLLGLLRMSVATGMMTGAVWAGDRAVSVLISMIATPHSMIATLLRLSVGVPLGASAYLLLCYRMRLTEVRTFMDKVRGRLRRR